MPYGTSTPALSTSSSSRGLTLTMGYLILRGASRLDAFSVYPVPTWLPGRGVDRQPVHQRSVHPGPLVLRTAPLRYPTPTPDRDRTVSRRSEPSSRTALMGEQPNPWDRLQPQDAMSRHRGAKPLRRCELLGVISLLSPGELLSVERWQSHLNSPGSLSPTFVPAPPVGVAVKLPSAFALFKWFPTILREPLSASDTLSEATAPVKLPA